VEVCLLGLKQRQNSQPWRSCIITQNEVHCQICVIVELQILERFLGRFEAIQENWLLNEDRAISLLTTIVNSLIADALIAATTMCPITKQKSTWYALFKVLNLLPYPL